MLLLAMLHLYCLIRNCLVLKTVFMQLPDYHEIIDRPMDFQTVRKKLDEGRYFNLDEFEVSF